MEPVSQGGLMVRVRRLSLIGLCLASSVCLILTACSTDGDMPLEPNTVPVDENTTAITFNGFVPETETVTPADGAATRGNMSLEDVSTNFTAYGFKNDGATGSTYTSYQTVMNRYRVEWSSNSVRTSTTNTDGWEYILAGYPNQTIKYWDWSAYAYRFFAISGSAGNHTGSIVSVTSPYNAHEPQEDHTAYRISFSVNASNPSAVTYFSHLWYSTGVLPDFSGKEYGRPVTLEFVQPLAYVRFMFVSADPAVQLADLMLEDPTFKPADETKHVNIEGTFTVSYPLTGTATTESWQTTPTDYVAALTTPWATEADWATVLPTHADDQGPYLLTVRVNTETKSCPVPEVFMNWQPGFRYTYVFKVKGDLGIELGTVNAAYTDWISGKEADYTIYNW